MLCVVDQSLERGASAAATARRLVVQRLADSGLDELSDAAALLTTELVTNVLVHTDSAPTVRVSVDADVVRIEVADCCPATPVAGLLDPAAGSGRGLVLVAQLTRRWGVTRVPDGKVVWAELVAGASRVEELDADELLDLWDDAPDPPPSVPDVDAHVEPVVPDALGPLRRVRLHGVSTRLLHGAKTHLDDLVRDLTLVNEQAAAQGRADERLVELAERLSGLASSLVGFRNQIRRHALDAVRRGDETLTLELELPAGVRGQLSEYRRALDEADEHCAAGRLLVPVATAEEVRFRRWKLDTIVAELGRLDAGGA